MEDGDFADDSKLGFTDPSPVPDRLVDIKLLNFLFIVKVEDLQ